MAILPYDQHLRRFAAYLQQLDMESNGKCVDRDGQRVDYETGPIIWGEPGTNGQHAFYQLIHQGTELIPADFLAAGRDARPRSATITPSWSPTASPRPRRWPSARPRPRSGPSWRSRGCRARRSRRCCRTRSSPATGPTTTILYRKLTPERLGSLVALYEHKVFVQGVIWDINSFDQWGVELGKQLASEILPELEGDAPVTTHDARPTA